MARWWWWWSFSIVVVFAPTSAVNGGEVRYDGRSLIINGQHKLLFSGSIHYPRSTPDMWPSLISKAKKGGLDAIETYVFWNLHEPEPGQYDFSGQKDIVRFIKEIQAQGLYAVTRLGPFVESEWNYGGFPFWLHDVPGIVYRSDNEPFKFYMKNFTTKIVEMFKEERLYASQGGPIILSQIENEYRNVEGAFHVRGPPYVKWAAEMAVGFNTGVPWVMCKQDDAPDPLINSCNGLKCGETFAGPNSPNKPSIWTENWTTHFQTFGSKSRTRSVEDIAFNVALFIAKKNGSFINYYMYHGGTNFGRTASAFNIPSYYDQAPLDEYGFIRQPKWGHLRKLHATIKQCSKTLLYGVPSVWSLGANQQVYVFLSKPRGCVAFLVNNDQRKNVIVQFRNSTYELPRTSISILPDCKTEVFNTAKVIAQFETRTTRAVRKFDSSVNHWREFREVIPVYEQTKLKSNSLLEHMTTTKDKSDYLWYTTMVYRESSSRGESIIINSSGHVLHAFVNGKPAGSAHGSFENPRFILNISVELNKGMNSISLLSATVGLPDSGAFLERRVLGPRRVIIQDNHNQKTTILTQSSWGYQVGMLGETLQLYDGRSRSVKWSRFRKRSQPLTWYKTAFHSPGGNDPFALNLGSMGKGEAWINGQSIGRYWISFKADGSPSQQWYNVPRSFLKPKGKHNHLVLFEEEGGNPNGISLDTVSISKVCSQAQEKNSLPLRKQRIHLSCPLYKRISKILFASYGNPKGDCESYAFGSCHSLNSTRVLERVCLGKRKCAIQNSSRRFEDDPCPGISKTLLVEALCQ